MKSGNGAARATARRLLPLYEAMTGAWVERARKVSTCESGCAHCCHIVAAASLLEGAAIADFAQRSPIWAKRIPELKARLAEEVRRAKAAHGDPRYTYAVTGRPCVMLDAETQRCTVYEARPIACRLHFVTSRPQACSLDTLGGPVSIIDPAPVALPTLEKAFESYGAAVPVLDGTLPEMILAGFELLERSPRDFKKWAAAEGVGRLGERLREALEARPVADPAQTLKLSTKSIVTG